MGLLSRRKTDNTQTPRSVMAAAMPLSGPGVKAMTNARKKTSEAWQKDAWYFYDVVGELRGPVTWIANAVSKADVFAAELDPDTGKVTGPTENDRAQAAAAMVLGGASKRAQLQSTIAIQWQVPGESYVVIRPTGVGKPDEWLVLSGSKVKPKGERWEYTDPITMMPVELTPRDRLIRIWSPHPDDQGRADSSVRPALVPLREIEKASQNISARLDSRLAGNGLLFVPQEVDFPQGDSATVAQALMDFLYEAMEASLQNPGQASAQVPIVVTAPGEFISQIQHLDIATAMDAVVTELRQDALSRLAASLDMPKPVAEGTQAESNHWTAWQVSEDTYQIFIEPLLDRIGDALTEYWFRPALVAMGVTDPERYILAWDTSSIVQRPGETEDLNWLYDNALISDDYRRAASGIPDDAIPSVGEKRRRELLDMVKVAPTLLADPRIGTELFDFEVLPEAAGAPVETEGAPAIEAAPNERTEPDTQGDVPDGLVAHAELLVFDALSRAGGRLLTRQYRGQFASTPKHELYLSIPVDDVPRLLEGSFAWVDQAAETYDRTPERLHTVLSRYTSALLTTQRPYDRRALRDNLRYL